MTMLEFLLIPIIIVAIPILAIVFRMLMFIVHFGYYPWKGMKIKKVKKSYNKGLTTAR